MKPPSSPWLIRTILTIQTISQIHLASALSKSPFYRQSLEELSDTSGLQKSLETLQLNIGMGGFSDDLSQTPPEDPSEDPSFEDFEEFFEEGDPMCANHPSLMSGPNLERHKIKDLNVNWAEESMCPFREQMLYMILEFLATTPPNVLYFSRIQSKPITKEVVCRGNKFGLFLAVVFSLFSTQRVEECHREEKIRTDFVSWEEYNNIRIPAVEKSTVDMYNAIDGWVCKYKMTDRGLAYYGLFMRKAGESIFFDTTRLSSFLAGTNIAPTLHFMEDYPKTLESALKTVTPDIGKSAEAMVERLSQRAAQTKSAMQIFGKKEKTKQEEEEVQRFCADNDARKKGLKVAAQISLPSRRYRRNRV
ncbi:hypothetical protein TWF718_003332 [Orbilia javanica]|uniref:Uncharacterized protein n=1 Tax=Orbilia javanica TaxID=47235 RepID=A0AAN8MP49_9PEZI